MITRALLVGIDKYLTDDASVADLGGCLNDLHLVHDTLRSVFDCPDQDIVTLTDGAATSANLRRAFSELVTGAAAGECAFFYYSGHGIRVPDFDKDEVESEFPWEVGEGWDEAIVTHDFSKTQPFLDDEIRALRSQLSAQAKLTMILDCCHSGGMPRASLTSVPGQEDPQPQPRGAVEISRGLYFGPQKDQLRQHKRSFVIGDVNDNFLALAACEPHEQAWEQWIAGKRHGLFTHALCNSLASEGSSVSARKLMQFADGLIRQQPSFGQTPRLLGNQRYFDGALFD